MHHHCTMHACMHTVAHYYFYCYYYYLLKLTFPFTLALASSKRSLNKKKCSCVGGVTGTSPQPWPALPPPMPCAMVLLPASPAAPDVAAAAAAAVEFVLAASADAMPSLAFALGGKVDAASIAGVMLMLAAPVLLLPTLPPLLLLFGPSCDGDGCLLASMETPPKVFKPSLTQTSPSVM